MAQLYSTGPALFYVGLPTQLASYVAAQGIVPIVPSELTTISSLPASVPLNPAQMTGGFNEPDLPPRGSVVSAAILTLLRGYTPFFLGTARLRPEIEVEPAYSAVHEDGGGGVVPADLFYEGRQGWVGCELGRFNHVVYRAATAQAGSSIFAAPPFNLAAPEGIDLDGTIGTLMVSEGGATPLWVVFPYAAKLRYQQAGMVPGYRFGAANIVTEKISPGSGDKRIRLLWQCLRLKVAGAYFLFDHDLSALGPPN